MRKIICFFTCSLLLPAVWSSALAQQSSTPAERLKLTLVDNASVFQISQEQNDYVNTLRLSQPDGDYKLTAGMLNDGDNYITFHRLDDQGNDTEFARINLQAVRTVLEPSIIGSIDFYNDFTHQSATISNNQLPENWSTDGEGLSMQSNGYAYTHSYEGLKFTVPEGYDNGIAMIEIQVGTDISGGYFAFKINEGNWSGATVTANSLFTTQMSLNSGDYFCILGADGSSLSYSPDIASIKVTYYPVSYMPTLEVVPTISIKNGTGWGVETALGNMTTYTVNDTINLYALGTIADTFNESTATNDHPVRYNYTATLDANVILPTSGSSGLDFYASADFTLTPYSNPTTADFTGDCEWDFFNSTIYIIDDNDNAACLIEGSGYMRITLPPTFTGNHVNVTVASCPGEYGVGSLIVNDESYTYSQGSTEHTWTVNVSANGVIVFKAAPNTDYSIGVTNIVISSGNGSSLNFAQHTVSNTNSNTKNSIKQNIDISKPIIMNNSVLNIKDKY